MQDTNFSSSRRAAVSVALATLGVLCLLVSTRDYTPNVQLSSVVGRVTNHVTRSAQGPAPNTPMGRRPIPLGPITQVQAKGVQGAPPSQPQVAREASAFSGIPTLEAEVHPHVHAHATGTTSTSDSTFASVMLGVAAISSIAAMYLWQHTATSGQYTELQGTTIHSGSPSLQGHPPRSYRIAMAAVEGVPELAKTALVVSNKGGGHGEIGFHLVKALRKKGLKVHLVNDTAGKSAQDFTKKPPFSQYHQFDEDAGVEVTYVDLSQSDALDKISGPFGYVFDNENVCQGGVAEKAAGWGSFYTYVSSGGMYLPGDQFPMPESNPTKSADKNGQKKHEELVMGDAIRPRLAGCAFFRPQYIVGPHTHKRDYLDWFFNRLVRKLPLPIPGNGGQTTTITDARDVSNMLAAVVGKEAEILAAEKEDPALGPIFNCASSTSASLNAIAMACGRACDLKDEEITELIKYYDPKDFPDLPKGGKFPFRNTNFDVGVEKATSVLGWECEYSADIGKVAKEYFEGYKELGLDTDKGVTFDVDADEASTDYGTDFESLRRALETGKFQDADDITRALLIQLAGEGAQQRGWVYFTEVKMISEEDMKTMDNLWRENSGGKFGFSVQKAIYGQEKTWPKFFKRINWVQGENNIYRKWPAEFIYTKDAEKGHLPLTNALRGTELITAIFEHPAFKVEKKKRAKVGGLGSKFL